MSTSSGSSSSNDQSDYRIYVAAVKDQANEDAGSSSSVAPSSVTHYHVHLIGSLPFLIERRKQHEMSWLVEYGVVRLRVSVNRRSFDYFPSSHSHSQSFLYGPSGVHVSATIKQPLKTNGNDDIATFYKILQRLVGDRWIAAPLASLQHGHGLRRHVDISQVDDRIRPAMSSSSSPLAAANNSAKVTHRLVEYSTTLPFQGSPLSAEGLQMLLQKEQTLSQQYDIDHSYDAPFLTTLQPNATVWSQILLGRLASAGGGGSSSKHDGRGLWMEWRLQNESMNCGNQQATNKAELVWKYGLYYSRPVSGVLEGLTLKDLIPLSVATKPTDNSVTDSSCSLSQVSLLTATDTTLSELTRKSSGNWLETVLYMNGTASEEATKYFGTCRSVLSETIVAAPVLATPDPFWRVSMRYQQQPYSKGMMIARVDNMHDTCDASVALTQTIPRVLKPIWQSLRVEMLQSYPIQPELDVGETCVAPNTSSRAILWNELENRSIKVLDSGSIQLRLDHWIPAQSSLLVSFDYDPIFLPFESFSADPNRGMELPPLVVHLSTLRCGYDASAALHSNSVLFLPPLPDMSMPFNVLSLTCTLYVFILGSLINHVVRRSSERVKYMLHPELKPKSKLQTIKERFRNMSLRRKQVESIKDAKETESNLKTKDQADNDNLATSDGTLVSKEAVSNNEGEQIADLPVGDDMHQAMRLLGQLLWNNPNDESKTQY